MRSSPKFRRYKAVFLKQKAQFGSEDLKMIRSNHTWMSLWSDEEWLKNYMQEQAENEELKKADDVS